MIWLIADTHFGHNNIIDYEERPYENIEVMDRTLICNWNKKVKENDVVYHLGDFALTHTQRQFEIFNQLNGDKYLIKGNHDNQTDTKLIDRMGFIDVYDEYWFDDNIILTHRPQEVEENILNIHGHIHGLFYENSKWKDDNHFCVSVELINYEPISIKTIYTIKLLNKL